VEYTDIAGRRVEVQAGQLTRVYFCGHCEQRDPAGYYHFWTMKNKEKKLRRGRCYHDKDPGWRFREMEGKAGYEEAWAEAQTAILVRPSSPEEVESWLNDTRHEGDAPCAQHGELNGQPIRIRRVDGHYIVEAMTPLENEDDRK